jgi:hypothetical protein
VIVDIVTLSDLADCLRERGATLRVTAEGPAWHVAVGVPLVLEESVVVNSDLGIALRMAIRDLDLRAAQRALAAERTGS